MAPPERCLIIVWSSNLNEIIGRTIPNHRMFEYKSGIVSVDAPHGRAGVTQCLWISHAVHVINCEKLCASESALFRPSVDCDGIYASVGETSSALETPTLDLTLSANGRISTALKRSSPTIFTSPAKNAVGEHALRFATVLIAKFESQHQKGLLALQC